MSLAKARRTPELDDDVTVAAIVLTPPNVRGQRRSRVRVPRLVRRIVGPIAVSILWQVVCSAGVFTSYEVASPIAVFDAGRQLAAEGVLVPNLLISLRRVAIGLGLGVGIGVVLAVLSGLFRIGEDLLDPSSRRRAPCRFSVSCRSPSSGSASAKCRRSFSSRLGSTFAIYINTFAGIRSVDSKLVEAGETFGLTRWGLVRRIILPGALPNFLVGLRLALVGSWLIVIVAEEINAQSGLGYLIMQAQTTDRTDIMMLGLAIYAILGLLADALVRLLERRLLVWRRGFVGA